jgi:hypothetical protein
MHAACWLLVTVLDRGRIVVPPIEYPDPTADFLEYTRRLVIRILVSGIAVVYF